MSNLFTELKRRNVFRVAVAYAIVGWLIIQVADILQAALLLPDWFTRVVAILIFLGLPLAVLFSWAFELTPEGIKKTAEVDAADSVTPQTGRKLDRMIIGALVLVVGLLLADRFYFSPRPSVSPPPDAVVAAAQQASIAVLPFVNMSSDPEQEYFSDGISEEILNLLAGIDSLQVTSRSSSFALKDQNLDIPAVAEKLGVDHILEGSVRKSGNQVRITAQLIRADEDTHLWSDTYDRTLDDIFAIQDEISTAIVSALKEELGLAEARPNMDPRQLTNPEAYAAYLRGNHLLNQRTRGSLESAVLEYRSALLLDPEFARAHAQLGTTLVLLRDAQYGALTLTDALAQAKPHIERALELDPGATEVHAAAGYYAWVSGEHEKAQAHWDRALEINPSYAPIFNWRYRMFSQDLGKPREAFEALEHARKLDPLSGPTLFNYLSELTLMGRHAEAFQAVEESRSLGPIRYYRALAGYQDRMGNIADAILAYFNVLLIDSDDMFRSRLAYISLIEIGLGELADGMGIDSFAWAELSLGKTESAVQLARNRAAEDPQSTNARKELAVSLAAAGQFDEAATLLRELWSMTEGRITSGQGMFDPVSALAAITVFRETADGALADSIIRALRASTAEWRDAGFTHSFVDRTDGFLALLTGDEARGIALLKKAAENGVFIWTDWAFLQTAYAHPEFAEVLAIQEQYQAEQQEILFATLCLPDNPFDEILPVPEAYCSSFEQLGSG